MVNIQHAVTVTRVICFFSYPITVLSLWYGISLGLPKSNVVLSSLSSVKPFFEIFLHLLSTFVDTTSEFYARRPLEAMYNFISVFRKKNFMEGCIKYLVLI